MTRILLTGGTGQLGTAITALKWPDDMLVMTPRRERLDLADANSIANYLKIQDFDLVINAGAYTAVDKAESEPDLANAVNAKAPGQLAAWCAARNRPMLHISTDYVFNGIKSEPYKEDDPTDPICVYGQTKRIGELNVQSANPNHAIVRTSWVISPHGQNFVKTMLRLGTEKSKLSIVSDQHGAPTSAADLAKAVQSMALCQLADPTTHSGIYHCTNAGETTWFGLAQEVFRLAAAQGGNVPVVEPITSADYPAAARRPANSRLDCQKIARDFGITLPHWTVALESVMQQMLTRQSGEPSR